MLASLALSLHFMIAEPAIGEMPDVNNNQLAAATSNKVNAMGNVSYELPDNLGTLNLTVPSNWVGGRSEGLEALWIDQNADNFKANLTLRIQKGSKVDDPEPLLDKTIEKLISNTGLSPVQGVDKAIGRRQVSFDTEIKGHKLRQDTLVLYTENVASGYLFILTSTDLHSSSSVDLTSVSIISMP